MTKHGQPPLTKKFRWVLSIVLSATGVWALSCCATEAPVEEKMRPGQAILDALPNAEFLLEGVSGGRARLENGQYLEIPAPGSESRTTVQLSPLRAVDDLNGDHREDAVSTLMVSPAGSGSFVYLAVLLAGNGAAEPGLTLFLGDRVTVQSVSVDHGEVLVEMTDRRSSEPLANPATVIRHRTFRIQDHSIVEQKKR